MNYKTYFWIATLQLSMVLLMAFFFFRFLEHGNYFRLPLYLLVGFLNWYSYKDMMKLYHKDRP